MRLWRFQPAAAVMRSKTFQHPGNRNRQPCNMASESTIMNMGQILRAENPESVEALTREAETLKAKLEEEKAKLNDVDSKYSGANGNTISLGWTGTLHLAVICVVCKL